MIGGILAFIGLIVVINAVIPHHRHHEICHWSQQDRAWYCD
jgi:hypothetical protein